MNRKRRNKTGFFLGILLLFLGSVSVTATEQESEPNQLFATAACLMDGDTGRVLFGKRETDPMAMASTTKIMTCILALENGQEQTVATASAKAAAAPKVHLGVREGEQFLLGDLLYSLMLESHNDAAVMIAETIGGSVEEFASLMNEKAAAIGCTDTHFVTPNGLDNGLNHYTTASDLAKIARYAWLHARSFQKVVGTSSYSFRSTQGRSYTTYTTNALLGTTPGVKGMKTGYTNKAGYCFAGVVKAKSGKTYISVTLGASSSTARWNDSRTLLNYAYNNL